MKTHWRAVDVFTDAANLIVADCNAIAADHSAKGLLASGATAKRAVSAFETRSMEALTKVLSEVANRIDHRGRRWRREMAEVERALDEHIQSAPELLDHPFQLAKLSESGRQAALQLVDWSAHALRKEFGAFRDGWTSPRSRPWRERNAAWYALLLIIAGAIVGQAANWAGKQFVGGDRQRAQNTNAIGR